MTFRIINTREAVEGPHGIRYVHDAARSFAVLRNTGKQEFCIGRFSTENKAKYFAKHWAALNAAQHHVVQVRA